jgi:hypothetical protein
MYFGFTEKKYAFKTQKRLSGITPRDGGFYFIKT